MHSHELVTALFKLTMATCIAIAMATTAWADVVTRGGEIYQANCAVCHAPDGNPDPESPVVQGLGVVPANFADTLFNSREGESEWKLVVTYGGAALAFDHAGLGQGVGDLGHCRQRQRGILCQLLGRAGAPLGQRHLRHHHDRVICQAIEPKHRISKPILLFLPFQ